MPITTPAPVEVDHAAGAPIWARFHCWSKYRSSVAPAPAAVIATSAPAASTAVIRYRLRR